MKHTDDKRDRDREAIPEHCPHCGGELDIVEISGTMGVHGPADRTAVKRMHGIDAADGDTIEWVGLNAHCPADHWSWLVARG